MRFCFIVLLISLFAWEGKSQSDALTVPFKYLFPTETTNNSIDNRKSPYLWRVFIDREDVIIYKDKGLKNESEYKPQFLEDFIVGNETDDAIQLFRDYNIDSIRFSESVEKIGWVNKDNLILWDRFLWGTELSKLIAITSWGKVQNSNSLISPSKFVTAPNYPSRYYIFNIVKFDESRENVLLSLRTFNNGNPDLFCWVKKKDLIIIDNRNGILTNRSFIFGNSKEKPIIYRTLSGLLNQDKNEIEFFIDSVRADEGFVPIGEIRSDINEVVWIENEEFRRGFLRFTKNGGFEDVFMRGILLNRQEFSMIKRTVDILSESISKEDYVSRWKQLYTNYNATYYEGMGQYDLFEELVKVRFGFDAQGSGTSLEDLPFISDSEFNGISLALEKVREKLTLVESDTDYPFNFAPFSYPHYWIPLEFIPLEVFSRKYTPTSQEETITDVDIWEYNQRPVKYESFDLFYVDNSHNFESDFELKDQSIKTFYRRAARIRADDPNKAAMVFLSNTQNPMVGGGSDFTESVAGLMREGVSSKPNRFNDKKLLRSYIYAKNIEKVDILRLHFFVGDKFYDEAVRSNRWILKELVEELHVELGAEKTEVILYTLSAILNYREFLNQINADVSDGISYRISTIKL